MPHASWVWSVPGHVWFCQQDPYETYGRYCGSAWKRKRAGDSHRRYSSLAWGKRKKPRRWPPLLSERVDLTCVELEALILLCSPQWVNPNSSIWSPIVSMWKNYQSSHKYSFRVIRYANLYAWSSRKKPVWYIYFLPILQSNRLSFNEIEENRSD
jgi:hypothetical protein